MKGKIGATMETWLKEENNLDKWQGRHLAKDLNNPMDWGAWSELSNDETFSQESV